MVASEPLRMGSWSWVSSPPVRAKNANSEDWPLCHNFGERQVALDAYYPNSRKNSVGRDSVEP